MRLRPGNADPFELLVLVALMLVSVWVVGLDLWRAAAHGQVWTGADGIYGIDQYQYMAWVRAASQHVLVSNLFVLRATPADYLQPAIVVSGGLTALGLAPWLALLIWKPVAVIALFAAVRAHIRRSLGDPAIPVGEAAAAASATTAGEAAAASTTPAGEAAAAASAPPTSPAGGVWPTRAALALALFFGSFTILYGSVGTIGDMFPGFLAWGYPFALLALAAMVAGVLVYARARARGVISWWPGVLGAVAGLLHPWHGALLIGVVLGAETVLLKARRPRLPQLALAALTVALSMAPLVYYVLLGRIDPDWGMAKAASKHAFPFGAAALELAPLLICALPAYRRRPRDFLAAVNLVWPPVAFALFGLSTTGLAATPLHALQGITLPLSVLAVGGAQPVLRRLPHPLLWGAALVAAFTIPGTLWQLQNAQRTVRPRAGDANFITRDERHALDYLARDPRPGGVLSRLYLGQLVPATTGRRTFVGDCLWSQPDCSDRQVAVVDLFTGRLPPTAARAFVRAQPARFLLADCRPTADLTRLLGRLVRSVHRFGCATVYEVAGGS